MPELPEVETICRQLAPRLEGREIQRVEVVDERWCAPHDSISFIKAIQGRTIKKLTRRGKYMVWEVDKCWILMHLRMTGAVLYQPDPGTTHVRAWIYLNDGVRIAFADPRRFGTAHLLENQVELEQYFAARLGVEPFSAAFTPQYLYVQSRNRRTPVKAFLLDQKHVAGVGNIYADEALFRAGIHPLYPVGKLGLKRLTRLHEAICAVLTHGIKTGGASIDDYRNADGVKGSFQNHFQVHRRADKPCPRCARTIMKIRAAGRGTYICVGCQRR